MCLSGAGPAPRPAGGSLDKGEEMGRFKLGSTVILLFPENTMEWDARYEANAPTRLGEVLATINT